MESFSSRSLCAQLCPPKLGDAVELFFRQRRVRRRRVLAHLLRVAPAGNDGADRRMREAERDRRLRERGPGFGEKAQLLDLVELLFEHVAGEIPRAHVLALEALLVLGLELAGQEPAPERHTDDQAAFRYLRRGKNFLARGLVEQIVFELDGLRPAALDRDE